MKAKIDLYSIRCHPIMICLYLLRSKLMNAMKTIEVMKNEPATKRIAIKLKNGKYNGELNYENIGLNLCSSEDDTTSIYITKVDENGLFGHTGLMSPVGDQRITSINDETFDTKGRGIELLREAFGIGSGIVVLKVT